MTISDRGCRRELSFYEKYRVSDTHLLFLLSFRHPLFLRVILQGDGGVRRSNPLHDHTKFGHFVCLFVLNEKREPKLESLQ